MVDLDGGGEVDLEEFVVWYIKYFQSEQGDSTKSPIENFYALLGTDRHRTSRQDDD
jgi:hypothetical protein